MPPSKKLVGYKSDVGSLKIGDGVTIYLGTVHITKVKVVPPKPKTDDEKKDAEKKDDVKKDDDKKDADKDSEKPKEPVIEERTTFTPGNQMSGTISKIDTNTITLRVSYMGYPQITTARHPAPAKGDNGKKPAADDATVVDAAKSQVTMVVVVTHRPSSLPPRNPIAKKPNKKGRRNLVQGPQVDNLMAGCF